MYTGKSAYRQDMGPNGHRPLIHVHGGTTLEVVPPLTRMQMWAVPVGVRVHVSIFLWYYIIINILQTLRSSLLHVQLLFLPG